MDQDIEGLTTNVCCSCLSIDRNLVSINELVGVYQIFKLLVQDLTVDRFSNPDSDINHLACWECLSLLKRFGRFRKQVQNAQDHLRVLAMSSGQGALDHTYMSQSLSNLEVISKNDYDKIFFEYSSDIDWDDQILLEGSLPVTNTYNVKNEHCERLDVAQSLRENIQFEAIRTPIVNLPVSSLVLDTQERNVSHILIREVSELDDNFMLSASPGDPLDMAAIKGELDYNTIEIGTQIQTPMVIKSPPKSPKEDRCGFTVEYMTQEVMLASREQMKLKVSYASAVYKCELCIIGFYSQQQVEDHFVAMHREKTNTLACKVCYCYIDENKLKTHHDSHYMRYECKLCQHIEYSSKFMQLHIKSHFEKSQPNSLIMITSDTTRGRKKKVPLPKLKEPCKPGDLRKLLSKKTIEGYQCLECDMFFKTSRARKNHVLRAHREGLQCDHCKKRFVNKTTLSTHMKLHEGPLPRSECPICHKQVRNVQIKYHIKRHSARGKYSCEECRKVFSYLTTYQAHLKYSRAHARGDRYRFPCPMCNKGYLTKEQMQDHFNYQHLGKTLHKCPICDKPIASRANVERHMARVHGEKKQRPRTHACTLCDKAFTDKKALTQHEVIHSGERPLVCEICHQTFKQKASLYTHKKRVHKVFPVKKVVEFIDTKPAL